MPEPILFTAGESGERLDAFLRDAMPDYSRSALQKLIEEGNVLLNGRPAAKNARLKAGDALSVALPPPAELQLLPEDIPLDIVYEDGDLLVVNKPKGMVVHPAPGNPDGTLVNALLSHCRDLSGINGVIRPGIVHRIDKNTSGLLIIHGKTTGPIRGWLRRFRPTASCGSMRRWFTAPSGRSPGQWSSPLGGAGRIANMFASSTRTRGTGSQISCCCCGWRDSATFAAGWRQGAPIRSGYTWQRWGIRWRGMRSMAPGR